VLRERAIEERMRRAGIDLEVVHDARAAERAIELVDLLLWDPRIGTAEETEHRRAHPRGTILRSRARLPVAAAKPYAAARAGGDPEAHRELLIERVKAADVRDDDDALVAAPGLREMGAEARAVLAREDHIRSTGAARDDR